MDGNVPPSLVLDSSYLLPAFGVELDFDSSEGITEGLEYLVGKGCKIYISDLSPLECFLKAFSLAEKTRNEAGKKAAQVGLLAVTQDVSTFTSLSYSDSKVLTEAAVIRNSHKDPFDCFIFATAKVLDAPLVTQDTGASKYLSSDRILTWKIVKRLLG